MSLPSVDGLDLRLKGPVLQVTMQRGEANLMSMEMCRVLTDLLFQPPAGARVMHLRASGPAFCLGRDRGQSGEDGLREEAETLVRLNRALSAGKLVTVAEVAGDAAGYGVGLAALSDLSFVSPSARIWFPEVEAGLAPTVVLSWLPALVGRSRAFRLVASGVRIDGCEAARIGLFTAVAESAEQLPELVASEVDMLLHHSPQPQWEIRAFLDETLGARSLNIDQLSVERLVTSSLRLSRAAH
jgi:methylglutaconyl-CoA hydratase